MINYGTRLLVDRSDYRATKIGSDSPPSKESLQDGEAIMEVNKFAYTSNNTTYAVFGDQVGYWKFFPVPEDRHGIIPCWGFATVIASKCEGVSEGSTFYGYYPMASHLIVTPDKISPRGFTDVVAHRQPLPVIYNQYIETSNDPLYRKEMEEFLSIFRPLFTTSFLIHDQFAQNDFYNSKQIILTSASSKTALGLASCLKDESVKTIGLTSARNVEMVKATGYYDEVYDYDHINDVKMIPSSYVDFAGNHNMQLSLQKHLGAELQYFCKVGVVHWEDQKGQEPLPVEGKFFFAPTYAAQRIKELGFQEFGLRLSKKFGSFVSDAKEWINLKTHKGGKALSDLHLKMTDGDIDAKDGHIVNF